MSTSSRESADKLDHDKVGIVNFTVSAWFLPYWGIMDASVQLCEIMGKVKDCLDDCMS